MANEKRFQGFEKFKEWLHKDSNFSATQIFTWAGIIGFLNVLQIKFSEEKDVSPKKWKGLKKWQNMSPKNQEILRRRIKGIPLSDKILGIEKSDWMYEFDKGAKNALMFSTGYIAILSTLKWLFPLKNKKDEGAIKIFAALDKPAQFTSSKMLESENNKQEYRHSNWRKEIMSESEKERSTLQVRE